MTNEELLSLNNGKKFDIVLMNPPYGVKSQKQSSTLHFQFAEKCLSISKKQVSIMPNKLMTTTSNSYDKCKKAFDNYLVSVDEVDSTMFPDTRMQNVGIYVFDENKNGNIKYYMLNGDIKEINSLLDIGSRFDEYEEKIFNICKNDKPNYNPFVVGHKKNKEPEILNKICDEYINRKHWGDKEYFLLTNMANGSMNATFISRISGQIIKGASKLKQALMDRKGARCNIMVFDTERAANMCKQTLINSYVLRFLLYRMQDTQDMTTRVWQVVPDVDWEDERVRNDETLLELCGCPKDKCKEYADYCKEVIEKVDNK